MYAALKRNAVGSYGIGEYQTERTKYGILIHLRVGGIQEHFLYLNIIG
jgi:hypothetical protein